MGKKRVKAGSSKAEAAAKRDLFAKAFIANRGNATQAAITAGYSAKTAKQAGSRMLTHVDVSAAIAGSRAQASESAQLTVHRTLREVARLAYFDPRKLYHPDGSLKKVTELDDDTAAGLASIEVEQTRVEGEKEGGDDEITVTKKLKLHDKNAALDKAMKHLGQYEEHNKQQPVASVNVGILTVRPESGEFEKIRARAMKRA